MADPRHAGPAKHSNEFRIVRWDKSSMAVTSAHGTGQAVADPRPAWDRRGKRTPSGPMICCLVEMAYLTGQRANDLLSMEWSEIGKVGILFQPGKTLASTGVEILILWTSRLEKLVQRLKAFPKCNVKYVFCKQDGKRYTYSGISSAWRRGLERAGIPDTQFRDLRAKALTDVDETQGITAAQRMGAHSTQAQTAEYVRNKKAIRATATR